MLSVHRILQNFHDCNLDFKGSLYVNHMAKISMHLSYETNNPLILVVFIKINNFAASWDSYLIWCMSADL